MQTSDNAFRQAHSQSSAHKHHMAVVLGVGALSPDAPPSLLTMSVARPVNMQSAVLQTHAPFTKRQDGTIHDCLIRAGLMAV